MPEQTSADFERVMAQCSRGCFTGLLRVRTKEGNGEVRFLSGIQDGIRFDSMEGDAALERLQTASDHEFEAISSLPPINAGSSEAVPTDGRLERFHAAKLMRYCESNSLTCALELEVEGKVLTARYRLGELLSVEPDSEHTARLAEAKVGMYRFRLPRFELPANVQQRRSVPAAPPPAAPAKVSPSKPAPASVAKPSPAALAETPLVGVRPVSVGGVPVGGAKAPAAAAKAPASSGAGRPAAPGVSLGGSSGFSSGGSQGAPASRPGPSASRPAPAAARPAASSSERPSAARRDEPTRQPAKAPAVAAGGVGARPSGPLTETPVMPLVQAKSPSAQPSAAVSPAPVTRVPRSPVPPAPPATAPVARASAAEPPASSAPASPPPKSAPLEGLWAEAVKPPAQSAPVELEAGVRAAPAAAPAKLPARAEGLSSLVYKPEEHAVSSRRQRASLGYWLVAFTLLFAVAVAGWFLFGR